MQSIDFKSYSATICLMIVSVYMYKHMLLHIFLYYKNSLKCEIYTCLQVSVLGQLSGRPLSSLVTALHSPNFSQFKYGVVGLIIVTVKPCYSDIEGTVAIVHFNLEKL